MHISIRYQIFNCKTLLPLGLSCKRSKLGVNGGSKYVSFEIDNDEART